MTKRETAWVAGLLEGEACFDFADAACKYPRLRVEMSDKDTILRLQELVGGSYRESKPRRNEWSAMYHLTVQKRSALLPLLRSIQPWMGSRRSAKIDELLAAVNDL